MGTKKLYLAANASASEDTTFRSPKSSIMPKTVLIEAKKNGVVVMPTLLLSCETLFDSKFTGQALKT